MERSAGPLLSSIPGLLFSGGPRGYRLGAGYRFLEKELQKDVRDTELGRRWADRLVEATTRDGEAMLMGYVISFERIGLRKGLEQGLEKGLLQRKSTLLRDLLTLRFGPLPDWTETKLAHADLAQLDSWAKKAVGDREPGRRLCRWLLALRLTSQWLATH